MYNERFISIIMALLTAKRTCIDLKNLHLFITIRIIAIRRER